MTTPTTIQDPNIGKPIFAAGLSDRIAQIRAALTELGLQDEQKFGYLQFSGDFGGRRATVTVAARTRNRYVTPDISYRRYTGLAMSVRVNTPVKTYLLFSNASSNQRWLIRWIQHWNKNKRVEGLVNTFNGHDAWARDTDWARQYLGIETCQDILRSLLVDQNHTVHFVPESCNLEIASVPMDLMVKDIQTWINQISRLSSLAEQRPPEEAKRTWIQRQIRKRMGNDESA